MNPPISTEAIKAAEQETELNGFPFGHFVQQLLTAREAALVEERKKMDELFLKMSNQLEDASQDRERNWSRYQAAQQMADDRKSELSSALVASLRAENDRLHRAATAQWGELRTWGHGPEAERDALCAELEQTKSELSERKLVLSDEGHKTLKSLLAP